MNSFEGWWNDRQRGEVLRKGRKEVSLDAFRAGQEEMRGRAALTCEENRGHSGDDDYDDGCADCRVLVNSLPLEGDDE